MPETSLDAFKAKDTRFVADWLKSKDLHKFCIIEATEKFPWPGIGSFDHLRCTYDGAFEQLFGLGRRKFEQNISTNSSRPLQKRERTAKEYGCCPFV